MTPKKRKKNHDKYLNKKEITTPEPKRKNKKQNKHQTPPKNEKNT